MHRKNLFKCQPLLLGCVSSRPQVRRGRHPNVCWTELQNSPLQSKPENPCGLGKSWEVWGFLEDARCEDASLGRASFWFPAELLLDSQGREKAGGAPAASCRGCRDSGADQGQDVPRGGSSAHRHDLEAALIGLHPGSPAWHEPTGHCGHHPQWSVDGELQRTGAAWGRHSPGACLICG